MNGLIYTDDDSFKPIVAQRQDGSLISSAQGFNNFILPELLALIPVGVYVHKNHTRYYPRNSKFSNKQCIRT